ncbi:MAG: hypothetical protein K0Q95_1762 [Bacteroidota bacterium]|jgi:hypothetical protein|nr:hypothetical protein [Bacteroidota bacterium]
MKLLKYISFPFVFAAVLISSCVKEKSFPPEPEIEFMRYTKYGTDSADCVISFKDGDGDIGLQEGDTASDDDFRLKYLYRGADGNFHPFDAIDSTAVMDTLFYSYRVRDITPAGQYKALEGEIKARLTSHPIIHPLHTAVKFEITLRDRAGHISNVVTSNVITP